MTQAYASIQTRKLYILLFIALFFCSFLVNFAQMQRNSQLRSVVQSRLLANAHDLMRTLKGNYRHTPIHAHTHSCAHPFMHTPIHAHTRASALRLTRTRTEARVFYWRKHSLSPHTHVSIFLTILLYINLYIFIRMRADHDVELRRVRSLYTDQLAALQNRLSTTLNASSSSGKICVCLCVRLWGCMLVVFA